MKFEKKPVRSSRPDRFFAKYIFATAFFGFLAVISSPAQNTPWIPTWNQADSIARSRDIPLLLVFSGSDWCKPCMRLEKTIFQSSLFMQNCGKKFAAIRADFPQKKNRLPGPEAALANDLLAAQYNPQGIFPYLLLISPGTGNRLILPDSFDNPEEFIRQIERQSQTLQNEPKP